MLDNAVANWKSLNMNEEQIKREIADFCELLPVPRRSACLKAEEQTTCPVRREVEGFKCDLCTFVISAAESWISDDATIDKIEEQVNKICLKLDKVTQPLCVKFVDYTLHKVIGLIDTEDGPEKICGAMGLCDATPSQ